MLSNSSLNDLGELRHTFRPKAANICAGAILGFALIMGGISAALFLALRVDPKPLRGTGDYIVKYGIITALGLLAPVGGVALIVWMKRLVGHRVSVIDNGFSYVYRGATEIVPWVKVARIYEVLTQENLKVLKVPGAVIKNLDRSFIVQRQDGKEFRFTVNSINSIRQFAAVLDEASSKHSIPWEQIER